GGRSALVSHQELADSGEFGIDGEHAMHRCVSVGQVASRVTVSAAVALASALLIFAADVARATLPEGVLIIHSNQRPTPAAIVFTPGYFVDGDGRLATPRQSLELIGAASAAPVYGPLDTFLGTGIVGGYMAPYENQAREAGAIVVRLLNGTAPTAIATSSIANVPVVDSRALRRFGIDERLLPPDAVVRFREPSAWDTYWREISIGIAIVMIQAG